MNRNLLFSFIVLALLSQIPFNLLRAQDANAQATTESRLRDALRSTMQQLQDAQGQIATLQATQAQSDLDKTALQTKLDGLTAQIKSLNEKAIADQAASDKKIADLTQGSHDLITEMVDTLTIQINLLNKAGTDDKSTLDKSVADMKTKNPDVAKALDQYGSDIQLWKTGYDQYVQFSNQTEAARAKLAAEAIMLHRLVDDREAKNLVLYNTANEILARYEKFSLGDALAAKEPFAGLTRVKLQEQVQDYKDKLLTEKLSIGQPPAIITQDTNPLASASSGVNQGQPAKP